MTFILAAMQSPVQEGWDRTPARTDDYRQGYDHDGYFPNARYGIHPYWRSSEWLNERQCPAEWWSAYIYSYGGEWEI